MRVKKCRQAEYDQGEYRDGNREMMADNQRIMEIRKVKKQVGVVKQHEG